MTDDDLRFGDIGGGEGDSPNDILELLVQAIVGVIMLYVLLTVIQTLFEIPIPFV